MELRGTHVVVTGAASGIGRALAARFVAEGARAVVAADVDGDRLAATAAEIGATAVRSDVSNEAGITALVDAAEAAHGPVDVFCSNAGIAIGGGAEVPDADWDRIWRVNVMAHVWAARRLVPDMVARGDGYLVNTASAAGLLMNLGAAPYSVTKHAAVAFAEWLAATHGSKGLKVSCLCPQGVRTPMLLGGLDQRDPAGSAVLASGSMLEPEDVAAAVVDAMADERFLVLPHPEVAEYMKRRGDDHGRWLAGMRRLQARIDAAT